MTEEEAQNPPGLDAEAEISALGELSACESLARAADWAARWYARASAADGVLLLTPHSLHPLFLCTGAFGEGTAKSLRRTAPRDEGVVHELVRDRATIAITREEVEAAADPFIRILPPSTKTCLVVPLEDETQLVGIAALLFRGPFDPDRALDGLASLLLHSNPALGRFLRADRKAAGMLQAIERLTNLFDLTKAFGSTIDLEKLCRLIVTKAADFAGAEVASLWLLEGDAGEVALAATAANENYDVSPVPAAVGTGVVGDVIADRTPVRRNQLVEDDPIRAADAPFPVRSILALPFLEDESVTGALVVVNKRGRQPEFTQADEELLGDLVKQAVRALRNARLYEAEKKVEELDALLAVSREITATLDLDKVMKTIVNASSALITFERCAIAVFQRGKLRLGAISGMELVNLTDDSVRRTDSLLEWVYFGGSDVAVTREEDGTVVTDRPETQEKFRAFFEASGRNAFYGVLLKDEEGKLGVLGFECAEPLLFDQETRDLVQILVNQATVAVRNAQLYQQVPLAGFWKPLLGGRRWLAKIPAKRTLTWGLAAAVTLVALFLIPWQLRVEGPARIAAGRRTAVTSPLDGFVAAVLHREGDVVEAGEVVATLRDDRWQAELAEASSALDIAESELSRHRSEGDAGAAYQALARTEELRANIGLATRRLEWTKVRAPVKGVIVTPRLDEKAGQFLQAGAEVFVLADMAEVSVEVAVSEMDATLLRVGEPMAVKVNPYPGRTFRGTVGRVGAVVHEEGEERFVIAESRMANAGDVLKPGMVGRAKVSVGRHSLAWTLFRKPIRWVWLRLWPILS
jgi:RND family efflux transporter MFP subunit